VIAVPTFSPAPEIQALKLRWHACGLVAGHGVASGMAPDTPYPAGTIALQAPLFAAAGLDLGPCFAGTLNLAFPGCEWRLERPQWHIERLHWTDRHPPESFSFWPCQLRWLGGDAPRAGWIYWPHPETKQRHFQDPDRLEVLAPWIEGIGGFEGLELGVNGACCRLVPVARLRARLLEFLKFRVLAAQAAFFVSFAGPEGMAQLRQWLRSQGWGEALDLSDADLGRVLEQARRLYTELT
jgi:hypothetical protein